MRAPRRAPSWARSSKDTILIGLLNPYDAAAVESYARQGLTGFAMEWLPRITRAQAMDVLSSQANIGGYKAVILAANEYQRFMPMLMTAAGTVKAARVLILGAGVAGLQAIATAKRLGAVIEASDVRPAVKEQIESLGAKFLDVPFLTDEEREIAAGCGRLRASDAGGLDAPSGRAGARTRQGRRHRHHHRAHPGAPGAGAAEGGHGQGDEARLGDRRHGHRAGRQLPA